MNNYRYCKTIPDGKTAYSDCVNGERVEVSKEVFALLLFVNKLRLSLRGREFVFVLLKKSALSVII